MIVNPHDLITARLKVRFKSCNTFTQYITIRNSLQV